MTDPTTLPIVSWHVPPQGNDCTEAPTEPAQKLLDACAQVHTRLARFTVGYSESEPITLADAFTFEVAELPLGYRVRTSANIGSELVEKDYYTSSAGSSPNFDEWMHEAITGNVIAIIRSVLGDASTKV